MGAEFKRGTLTAVHHEINDRGQHRVVMSEVRNKKYPNWADLIEHAGEWAGYQNYASLTFEGTLYIAVTQYFDGGVLKPETVYEAKVAEV